MAKSIFDVRGYLAKEVMDVKDYGLFCHDHEWRPDQFIDDAFQLLEEYQKNDKPETSYALIKSHHLDKPYRLVWGSDYESAFETNPFVSSTRYETKPKAICGAILKGEEQDELLEVLEDEM